MQNLARHIAGLPAFAQEWARTRLEQLLAADGKTTADEFKAASEWLAWLPLGRPKMMAKLHKLTWPQALLAASRWADTVAGRAAQRAAFGGAPDDCTPALELEEGYHWVLITSPQGLDFEGAAMGHCVGRGSYDGARIYSLRDRHGMPHATLQHDEARSYIAHIQGRPVRGSLNNLDARYRPMVNSLVANLGASINPKLATIMGMVLARTPGGAKRLLGIHEFMDTANLTVDTDLDITDNTELTRLPPNLNIMGRLAIQGCTNITELPADLSMHHGLHASGCTGLRSLPAHWTYLHSLDIRGCTAIIALPTNLRVAGNVKMSACPSIQCLPSGLVGNAELDIDECTGLVSIANMGPVLRRLSARGCTSLQELPAGLTVLKHVDLSGCTRLKSLPDNLDVKGSLKMVGCTSLEHMGSGIKVGSWISLLDCPAMGELPTDLVHADMCCRTMEQADEYEARMNTQRAERELQRQEREEARRRDMQARVERMRAGLMMPLAPTPPPPPGQTPPQVFNEVDHGQPQDLDAATRARLARMPRRPPELILDELFYDDYGHVCIQMNHDAQVRTEMEDLDGAHYSGTVQVGLVRPEQAPTGCSNP